MGTWEERVAAANDETSRRRLLAELGGWRARNLGDILALREAARAMASLYALLGDNSAAVREAESLVSLCQTHPAAGARELREAQALARSLGGGGVVGPRAARSDRGRKPKKAAQAAPPAEDKLADARAALRAGELDRARKLLRRKKGDAAALLKAAVWVEEIRHADAAEREASLDRLSQWLQRFVGGAGEAKGAAAPEAAPSANVEIEDSPLSALLGASVPSRRRALIRTLERAAQRDPSRIGELASAALEHHVQTEGLEAPAPWLVGLVATAVLAGHEAGPLAAIASLEERGAAATRAYGEWSWTAALDLARGIEDADFMGLRRGVLARGGEPEDRKVWTLRMSRGEKSAFVALLSPHAEAYPEAFAAPVAARIAALAPGGLLVAPGEQSASLRAAAADAGLAVSVSEDLSDWLQAVVWHTETPARPERAASSPAPRTANREDASAALLAALAGDPVDEQALEASLAAYERLHHAFVAIRDQGVASSAQLAFLRAVHRAAPEKARLPEGTSIALRLAAAGDPDATELLTQGETAMRYGGEGIGQVIDVARAMSEAGLLVDRATRGATARERRQDPVLSALGAGADAVWRVEGSRDGELLELALMPTDTPEARAALPRLWRRSKAVLVEEAAQEWCSALEGPAAFTTLSAAMAALSGA
jgi:hypothetical protein